MSSIIKNKMKNKKNKNQTGNGRERAPKNNFLQSSPLLFTIIFGGSSNEFTRKFYTVPPLFFLKKTKMCENSHNECVCVCRMRGCCVHSTLVGFFFWNDECIVCVVSPYIAGGTCAEIERCCSVGVAWFFFLIISTNELPF